MNYEKIYNSFLNDAKITSPKERINRRNNNDSRLVADTIYVEYHHIIPKSQGGSDSSENLVCLLPEEHLFVHFMRWKVFGNVKDLYAYNWMINGFMNKPIESIQLTKVLRRSFRRRREEFGKFISAHNKGSQSISAARKGTMPVKCAITGNSIGSVSVNHEKVKSGEWIHTSAGRKLSKKEKSVIKERCSGLTNPNAHSITNDDFVLQTAKYVLTQPDGRLIWKDYQKHCEDNNLPFFKSFSGIRFGGSKHIFIATLTEYCNKNNILLKYDRFYRSEAQKKLLSESITGRKRYYNDDNTFKVR